MQPLGLTAAQLAAYHARLFTSHDYRIDVDVLDLNENPTGSAIFLDGQINIVDNTNTVRRTASLNVSDPTGALDFAGGSTWSGSTIWVDRLVRIRHTIHVPALGKDITVTPFIGPPSTVSRNGAEVSVELQDKTALAMHGASPLTVAKGTNAVSAIKTILQSRTGEFRFRLGTTSQRLGSPRTVGWAEEASPWAIATAIAKGMGAQLIYSCDGYVTLRKPPQTPQLVVPHVTAQPSDNMDFTLLKNYVQVSGKATSTTNGSITTTTQPQAVAQVTAGNTSPSGMARKGVKRYLPLVVQEDAYTTLAQVQSRATSELDNAARVQGNPTFACVPFFHLDVDDIVRFTTPGTDVDARLNNVSIPLGCSGDMSVGYVRWVSALPGHSTTKKTLVTRKKK